MTKITVTIEAENAEEAKDQAAKLFGLYRKTPIQMAGDAQDAADHLAFREAAKTHTPKPVVFEGESEGDDAPDLKTEVEQPKAAPVKRGRVAKVETVLTGDAKAAGQPAKPVVLDPDAASGDPADAGGSDDGEEVSLDDLPADSNKFNDWILDCVSRVTSTGKTDKITALKQIAGIMKENADGARSGEQLYMKKDPAMVLAVVQGVTKLVNDYVSG